MRILRLACVLGAFCGCGGDAGDDDGGSDGSVVDLRGALPDLAHDDAARIDALLPVRDAGPPPDLAGFAEAPHTGNLQLTETTKDVITKPQLVTVTFPNYIYEQQAQMFGDFIVASSWLTTVGASYGIGAGTHLKKVVLANPAPGTIDDAGIQALINQSIQSGMLPAPTSEIIYAMYMPPLTTVTGAGSAGQLCASGAFGYHFHGAYNGTPYAYSVIADCAMTPAQVEGVSAHELIEAATDPGLATWSIQVASDDPWTLYQASEVADVCEGLGYAMEGGYVLPRVWSNAAAAADGAPCLPASGVYYNVTASPATIPKVAAGSSATFVLTGWSQAAVADWTLSYYTPPNSQFDAKPSLDVMMMNNGKTAMLTLTVPNGTQSGLVGGTAIVSGIPSGRFWPVAIEAQ